METTDAAGPVVAVGEATGSVARSASVLSLGNGASRVLGLVRQIVVAYFFGASGQVSAWRLAAAVPTMIYDLLIEGLLSAALVPLFSEYLATRSRAELWRLAGVVLSAAALVLGAVVLILEALAPQVAWLLGPGFSPELLELTTRLIRLMLPAALVFGLSGIIVGLLYALKRFTFTAIAGAVFNLGVVLAAPLLAGHLGVYSLGVGVLLGAGFQLAALLPGLRGVPLRFTLNWRHAGLRRLALLYAPVVASLIVSRMQVVIDRNLASHTGEQSIAWMDNATTLFQFPHGLVAIAISLAILPALSQHAARRDTASYQDTLLRGLRLVLTLAIPATVGLFVLARPIIRLIYEHGVFTSFDTQWTSTALRCYLVGLIFASVDWPLNYASYARQNTLTPALVGVLSVGVYLVMAVVFAMPLGRLGLALAGGVSDTVIPDGRYRMLGLVLADASKQASHAIVMWLVLRRQLGGLPTRGFWLVAGKAAAAGLVMGASLALALPPLQATLGLRGTLGGLFVVGLGGLVGLAIYLGVASLLRLEEIALLYQTLRAGLSRFRSRQTKKG